MRIGATIFNQNYADWDRYEAAERGEPVPARPAKSDREIFLEELGLAVLADEVGFDSVWTIEHHFTPYTMVTNPLQYLTYIAGVTKRVHLGTMVTVLPWHNPVRVAEDVNMLDTFLGDERDIIVGVGRGLGRREYGGLGIDQNEARDRFDAGIAFLKQLLATGEGSFEGSGFHFQDVRLRPQPGKDLSPNLWCAGGTEQSVQIIAKHGVNPLVIPTTSLESALANLKRYAQLRELAGHPPANSKLAAWTYVAETEADAERDAGRYMIEYSDSALRHYEMLGSHFDNLKGYESYAKQAAAMRKNADGFRRSFYDSNPWGTPDKVIARATELAEQFGANELMFVFRYGSMPIEKAEASMRLFAREVLPELQKLNPGPLRA